MHGAVYVLAYYVLARMQSSTRTVRTRNVCMDGATKGSLFELFYVFVKKKLSHVHIHLVQSPLGEDKLFVISICSPSAPLRGASL